MNKVFNTIVAVLLAAFGIFATWSVMQAQKDVVKIDNYDVHTIISGNNDNGNIPDHVLGNKDAKIVIFEYADYECGYCAKIQPEVKKLIKDYGDKIAFVYRNVVLSYHKDAVAATAAAEAAGVQGYWKEYQELLFANQALWSQVTPAERTEALYTIFKQASKDKGDLEKFKKDLNSKEVKRKVDFDGKISAKIKVPGTPSFYMDGEQVDLAKAGLDSLRDKINAKLGLPATPEKKPVEKPAENKED